MAEQEFLASILKAGILKKEEGRKKEKAKVKDKNSCNTFKQYVQDK